MTTLPAHRVATPVLERLAGEVRGVVLGAGATAAWVDLAGLVVAVTTRQVPLLPNAVALAAGAGALTRAGVGAGAPARGGPGRVDLGPARVTWDPAAPPAWDPTVPVFGGEPGAGPPAWDPTVPAPIGSTPEAVARRGAALLGALGVCPDPSAPGLLHDPDPAALVAALARGGLATAADLEGAAALTLLFRAVRERDPEPAAGAARALLGRGPGLTPEGDDLLAAVAGTLAVLGPAVGLPGPAVTTFLDALAPMPGRTTALSATLLALAWQRRLAEPAGRLLDLGPAGEAAWPGALSRLERLGHGSGRAYAVGIAAAASLLAAGAPVR